MMMAVLENLQKGRLATILSMFSFFMQFERKKQVCYN